jgi:hypothetical protein
LQSEAQLEPWPYSQLEQRLVQEPAARFAPLAQAIRLARLMVQLAQRLEPRLELQPELRRAPQQDAQRGVQQEQQSFQRSEPQSQARQESRPHVKQEKLPGAQQEPRAEVLPSLRSLQMRA